jgi:ribosomal protein S27AE
MKKICTQCGMVAKPKKITPGSIFIELILWCCFLVPGSVYSIWRLTSKKQVCPKCGAANMAGLDSPVGRKLITDLDIDMAAIRRRGSGAAISYGLGM